MLSSGKKVIWRAILLSEEHNHPGGVGLLLWFEICCAEMIDRFSTHQNFLEIFKACFPQYSSCFYSREGTSASGRNGSMISSVVPHLFFVHSDGLFCLLSKPEEDLSQLTQITWFRSSGIAVTSAVCKKDTSWKLDNKLDDMFLAIAGLMLSYSRETVISTKVYALPDKNITAWSSLAKCCCVFCWSYHYIRYWYSCFPPLLTFQSRHIPVSLKSHWTTSTSLLQWRSIQWHCPAYTLDCCTHCNDMLQPLLWSTC